MRLIFDSHLDLGWTAVFHNRDLTQSVEVIREREHGMTDEPSRGKCVLSLPELRAAGVGICVATLLARAGPEQKVPAGYKRSDLDYAAPSIAYAAAHAQLAWYRLMESQGRMRMIRTRSELAAHLTAWRNDPANTPLGYILSMEGADPVTEPDQLRHWWDLGLRAISPAHYGRGQYAYGTGVDGPLGERGVALLRQMERLGILLDVTHLSDTSFAQAVDVYGGPMLASHHNCRSIVPGDRQLTDEQIKLLIGRGAVIGAALDAWMLYPNWIRGVTQPEVVGLAAVADHIDRVCQLAGNARHAALGTDLDGGFGFEQTPRDLKRYRDLQTLGEILSSRGWADEAIDAVFHGNWLRFFSESLPT